MDKRNSSLLRNQKTNKEMRDIRTQIIECCICDTEISKWESNNAEPIQKGECCDDCNYQYVVPERMKQLLANNLQDTK